MALLLSGISHLLYTGWSFNKYGGEGGDGGGQGGHYESVAGGGGHAGSLK